MIHVTIELHPGGDANRARHLGTIDIWNDTTGSMTRGNYKARLSRRNLPDSTWKGTEVKGFQRKQKTAYDLLYLVLRNVVGERNS